MMQAMNTGHDGSLTTLHANSPAEAVGRLVTMVRFATELPVDAIETQIASALDVVVQTARTIDGERFVSEAAEVVYDRDKRLCVTKTIYKREPHVGKGTWFYVPRWIDELPLQGIATEKEVRLWKKRPVFGCLSVMLAFAAACSLSVALTAEVASDRKRAAAAQLDSSLFRSGIAARRLRNGFGFSIPLSRKLLKARFLKSRAEKCVWLLAKHGWATNFRGVAFGGYGGDSSNGAARRHCVGVASRGCRSCGKFGRACCRRNENGLGKANRRYARGGSRCAARHGGLLPVRAFASSDA